MRFLGLIACALAGGCMQSPAAQIGPNDYLRLDQGANGTKDIENTSFNGSLVIWGSQSCTQTGNQTNGSLDASGCR